MVEHRTPIAAAPPWFSVVIPVFNDWGSLKSCVRSLARQRSAPTFEVIVVDDGSASAAPEYIVEQSRTVPLRIVREPHRGIAAARNRGIEASQGRIIVCVDADCTLDEDCLAELAAGINRFPAEHYFQLHLLGDCSGVVGRSEELRLRAIQYCLVQPDGRIRYLNTAGFAIRREAGQPAEIFDPLALRAEDTLLLSQLIHAGELPRFVETAKVTHAVPLTLVQCVGKDFRSAPKEARAYRMIARSGVSIRMNNRSRLAILRFMWRASSEASIGRATWFLLVARQTLQRALSILCELPLPGRQPTL